MGVDRAANTMHLAPSFTSRSLLGLVLGFEPELVSAEARMVMLTSGHTSLGTTGWCESLHVHQFRAILKMVGGEVEQGQI